jgi:shikimate dehydrogenase
MRAETTASRRCAVIGSPIAHSLSPALHHAAYQALELSWTYDALDVTVEQLPDFLAGLRADWRGLSVTMPLKRPMLTWCHEVDPLSALVGSVNTVVLEADGRRFGYNTDITGLVAALQSAGIETVQSLVVVGGGATAASALVAGAELGCSTATVLARDPQRSAVLSALGERCGVRVALRTLASAGSQRPADLLISTIPAKAQPPYVASLVELAGTLLDVTYAPWRTPLLQAAESAERRVVYGFELLLHQAVRQVELMTGVPAGPLAAMRAAGLVAAGQPS